MDAADSQARLGGEPVEVMAAVDLGSNSFHMVVARNQHGEPSILDRLRETVRLASTNRLHDQPDLPEPVRRTEPWGLGWRLNHRGTTGSWGDALGERVFGHTGATGTTVWMDPDRDGFCLLLTNALRAAAPWRLVQLSNIVASAFV